MTHDKVLPVLTQCQLFYSLLLGQNLNAELYSRVANVKLQEDIELFCRVSSKYINHPMLTSITWQFQPSSTSDGYQPVVKVTAGGTIEWGSIHLHFQRKTKITKSSTLSQLQIHSATWQDAGIYKCEVEAQRNVIPSNPVEIRVTKPGRCVFTFISLFIPSCQSIC